MMDKLMKLKEAKGSSMRPVEKEAKSAVLKDILSEASKEMGEGLKGIKKGSGVFAEAKKAGPEDGLAQAAETVDEETEGRPYRDARLAGGDDIGEDGAEDMPAAHEHSPEEEQMEPHEIDAKIKALTELKHKKMTQKGE